MQHFCHRQRVIEKTAVSRARKTYTHTAQSACPFSPLGTKLVNGEQKPRLRRERRHVPWKPRLFTPACRHIHHVRMETSDAPRLAHELSGGEAGLDGNAKGTTVYKTMRCASRRRLLLG